MLLVRRGPRLTDGTFQDWPACRIRTIGGSIERRTRSGARRLDGRAWLISLPAPSYLIRSVAVPIGKDRKKDRKLLAAVLTRSRVPRTATKYREHGPRADQRFAAFRPRSRIFADLRFIGAPRFEPGTSPTRTVRATRLRHAPTRQSVFHTAIVRRVPAATATDILAELDRLLEPERFEDYGPNGLQVPGASEVDDGRDRRLGQRRSCSSWPPPSTRSCCSSTTASSGAPAQARSTPRSSAA